MGDRAVAAAGARRRRVLGRGRSGCVYLEHDAEGRPLAAKVFSARGLVRLVQVVLLGAPNPYQWCRAALEAARLRRELLAALVRFWFGERLRVAAPRGVRWCAQARAWVLETEFIAGRHAALSQPFRPHASEARRLEREILRPLRVRLREAGLIGMCWQAGEGNPVALNNFMLEQGEGAAEGEPLRWVWIDLESGVPALFSPHPLSFARFLWASLRLGRPLFDDVEPERLRAYLAANAPAIDRALGPGGRARLEGIARRLERAQAAWKGMSRFGASLAHARVRGRIDRRTWAWYARRPLRWYLRLGAEALSRGAAALVRACGRALTAIWRFEYLAACRYAARLVVSAREREALARRLVERRIRCWRARGQLRAEQARRLEQTVYEAAVLTHVTDFGMHLALKPLVKALTWWALPACYAMGWVPIEALLVGVAGGGPLARTVYTAWRCVDARRRRRALPWLALGIGALPVVGNLAFALQLVWSASEEGEQLGRFLIYDACTRVGAALPIWGGADTATEHAANRIGDWLPVRGRARAAYSAGLESAALRALDGA